MCRHVTQWKPNIDEQRRISSMIQQSWKTLSTGEQTSVKLVWIIAAIVALTDPLGFYFVATIFMLLTPPFLYTEMATAIGRVKKFFVNPKSVPGLRIAVGVGIASIVTALAVASHEIQEEYSV